VPGLVKVTVAPSSAALTTLAAAQTECGTTDDVTTLIDRASAVIAAYCGRAFGLQTIAETFRLGHHGWHRAPHRRVAPLVLQYKPAAISSVTEDGTALTADVDYELDGQLLHRLCGDFRREWFGSPIVATYTTGWMLPGSVPADLEAACLALVRGAFNYIGSDPTVSRDQTEGVGLVNYFARSASGLVVDAGLAEQLSAYVVRVW
jgi:hypothetical protein